nr:TadE/TadG family type IV pilus assembly protein [Pararhodobacter sp. SW119]
MEAVLWTPVFIAFIALVFDASMILMNRAHVLRAIQDGNRAYAVGRLDSLEATEAAIAAGAARFGAIVAPESTRQGDIVQSVVRVRAGDLSGVGLLQPFANMQLTIFSHHLIEN